MNQKLIVLAIIVGLVVVGLVTSNNQLGVLNTQAVTYKLTVTTTPASCTVKINGILLPAAGYSQTSPATFMLQTGLYTLTISKTGYSTVSRPAIIIGTAISLSVTLTATTPTPPAPPPPATYTLLVKTSPSSCTVKVSSYTQDSGTAGYTFTLSAGTYTVTTSKTGYNTDTRSVSLSTSGGNTQIYVILTATPTPPPPPPQQVTCYQCQGGNPISNIFTGTTCPSGWFLTSPNCYVPPTYYNLQVTVTNAVNYNAIGGASVTVGGKSASTVASGIATFSSLAEGSYTIIVTATGYQTATGSTYISGSDGYATIQMTPLAYSILLTVVDSSTQAPISGASVTIGSNQPQMTDTQGKTTFVSMPSNTYSIAITKSGYTDKTDSVTVSSIDVPKTISIVSIPVVPSTFTLTVYTRSNATVTITNSYPVPTPATIPIQTTLPSGPTGIAVFTNIPSGTYTLTIKKDGYTTKTESVTITANQAVNAPIEPLPIPPKAIPGFETVIFMVALGISMIIIYKRNKK